MAGSKQLMLIKQPVAYSCTSLGGDLVLLRLAKAAGEIG